jgi:DNA-binding PucR family transcriptional regulator
VSAGETWERPSHGVAELIRAAALALMESPQELFAQLDAAVLATSEKVAEDPVLAAAVSASNRANLLHWATANVRDPGAPVAPNLGPETLDIALDVVRRGLDDAILNAYRVGQNVAWRYWMNTAFALGADPEELRAMLDLSARSTASFVDQTIAGIQAQIERERTELAGRTHAERMELVNLIIEGSPITSARASERLRYELSRRHIAAVLWIDSSDADQGALERAAEALARAAGARRSFTVLASASSVWAWFASDDVLDLDAARAAIAGTPGVRVALGSPGAGIDGFRRSHLDALSTQRLMHRMPSELRLAAYRDVELVALTAHDEERASEFVASTLGALAGADAVLRETLRVYIREQFSAARAARALYAHRNTVLNRLAKAQELLPVTLAEHGLEVGLALEILHWLGPRAPLNRARGAAR